jgi:hypothetical protein
MNQLNIENIIKNKNFLDNFLKDKKYIYTTTTTEYYVDMTYNWFLSLKNIKQEHLVLVGAIGEECFNKLKKLNIPSVLIDIDIGSNFLKSEWVENEKKIKLILPFYIFLKYKLNMFISDTDVFFNKNPYLYIEPYINENYDLFIMSDKRFDPFLPERKLNVQSLISTDKLCVDYCGPTAVQLYGEENGGFCFFNYKETEREKIFNFFNGFIDGSHVKNKPKGDQSGCLQTITNELFKKLNINTKLLNCYDFVNGSIWSIEYLKQKIKDTCCMIHYNYCKSVWDLNTIDNKIEKIKWMKENNHWLL